jgi:hypothetical protein
MTRLILIAVAMYLFPVSNASAGSVAHCGGSFGYAYHIQGGLVTEKESGWGEDSISKGQLLLIKGGKDFVILMQPAAPGVQKATVERL